MKTPAVDDAWCARRTLRANSIVNYCHMKEQSCHPERQSKDLTPGEYTRSGKILRLYYGRRAVTNYFL